jgi:hypothetical protein
MCSMDLVQSWARTDFLEYEYQHEYNENCIRKREVEFDYLEIYF